MNDKLTVIDFFCGAGGFSEGFRQQGYNIVMGLDKWLPAVQTFNHNFNLRDEECDILKLSDDIQAIQKLPDTDIIIGSPPCVSFSNSNKSGKADKSLGLRLTEAFLKIVAIKKYQQNSMLKAWFMENVSNSLKYIKEHYTFNDLGLNSWAKKNGYNPKGIALSIVDNSELINSAEYGAAQSRKRAITGEIISKGKFISPIKTHQIGSSDNKLQKALTLGDIKKNIPSPTRKKSNKVIIDPLYPSIRIPLIDLSDHFYDTGLFECQWKNSRFMKRNHPFMGRMSFPENESKPSRTLTATNIGTSREAIIYKSSYKRKGNGEFRVPTIREMATLMGFPITFQFLGGSEASKGRLVGNAVCISVSRALAKMVRIELGLKKINHLKLETTPKLKGILNLNTFSKRVFGNPPKKNKGSRFRRHPFKDGNITVTLSNYDIEKNSKKSGRWITSVQFGNGNGFPTFNFRNNYYSKIERLIKEQERGQEFIEIINNGFSEKIASREKMQRMYEHQQSEGKYLEPTQLVERIAEVIEGLGIDDLMYKQNIKKIFKIKELIPVKQMFALYAINKISSIANNSN